MRSGTVLGDNTLKTGRPALKTAIEIIGWSAAALMLAAYFLLTSGRLESKSRIYQWLNILAGAGLIVNSGWNGAYPSVFLNVIWVGIGLYGLAMGLRIQTESA